VLDRSDDGHDQHELGQYTHHEVRGPCGVHLARVRVRVWVGVRVGVGVGVRVGVEVRLGLGLGLGLRLGSGASSHAPRIASCESWSGAPKGVEGGRQGPSDKGRQGP
jgi:hypothetical protein